MAVVISGYVHQRNLPQRYRDLQVNQEELDDIRAKVKSLRDQVESTRSRVEKLESDPLEIEATIRQDRRMTRDGEIIFHVEDAPEGEAAAEDGSSDTQGNE